MDTGYDVYECIEPVTYGRRDFSPNAEKEKSRLIKLPFGTPIDNVISTYFKKRGVETVSIKPDEATAMDKEAVIDSLKVPLLETLETLEKKFGEHGFDFDGRWSLETAKNEFDIALKAKEENSNEE